MQVERFLHVADYLLPYDPASHICMPLSGTSTLHRVSKMTAARYLRIIVLLNIATSDRQVLAFPPKATNETFRRRHVDAAASSGNRNSEVS